jgi:hypothetical protein
MTTQEKVQRICEILQALGQPGSVRQLAFILNTCPSTIGRYLSGEIAPRSQETQESISFLHRILTESVNGNQQAKTVLDACIGQRGLVRMGLGGAVIALGMTWLARSKVGDQIGSKPCDSSADRPTMRNSTTPSSASRKRQSARRPSKKG